MLPEKFCEGYTAEEIDRRCEEVDRANAEVGVNALGCDVGSLGAVGTVRRLGCWLHEPSSWLCVEVVQASASKAELTVESRAAPPSTHA